MGNSGNRKFVDVLRRLREDEDPVVAESAGWALQKLMGEESGLTGTEERGCPSLHRQTAKEWFIPWHKS
jgi:hypothetical protein